MLNVVVVVLDRFSAFLVNLECLYCNIFSIRFCDESVSICRNQCMVIVLDECILYIEAHNSRA